jgi:hypothetical protein
MYDQNMGSPTPAAPREQGLEHKMNQTKKFFVAQTEHWSSGSAAAIFDSEESARAAFYGNGSFGAVEEPLEKVITSQRIWLKNSEERLGFCGQIPEIAELGTPEGDSRFGNSVPAALWAGLR